MKILAIAQALELKIVSPETMINVSGPLRWGKVKIRDFHNYGSELPVKKVISKSSNTLLLFDKKLIAVLGFELKTLKNILPISVELFLRTFNKILSKKSYFELILKRLAFFIFSMFCLIYLLCS